MQFWTFLISKKASSGLAIAILMGKRGITRQEAEIFWLGFGLEIQQSLAIALPLGSARS